MEVCPVKSEYVEEPFEFESQGLKLQRKLKRLTNADTLPIKVERWRLNHTEVSSATWIEALRKVSDDKAKSVEIDRKRAIRRADLIDALRGNLMAKAQLKQEIE